jgi:integrase/recombinase XerD
MASFETRVTEIQSLGCDSEAVKDCGFSHSSRMSHLAATGITIYLENDGRLEHAQQMAGHESPRTTKLCDRTKDEITLSEVERNRL